MIATLFTITIAALMLRIKLLIMYFIFQYNAFKMRMGAYIEEFIDRSNEDLQLEDTDPVYITAPLREQMSNNRTTHGGSYITFDLNMTADEAVGFLIRDTPVTVREISGIIRRNDKNELLNMLNPNSEIELDLDADYDFMEPFYEDVLT